MSPANISHAFFIVLECVHVRSEAIVPPSGHYGVVRVTSPQTWLSTKLARLKVPLMERTTLAAIAAVSGRNFWHRKWEEWQRRSDVNDFAHRANRLRIKDALVVGAKKRRRKYLRGVYEHATLPDRLRRHLVRTSLRAPLGEGPDHRTALRFHRLSQKQKNELYKRQQIARGRSQRNKMPKRYGRRRRGGRKRRPRYRRRPRSRVRRRRRRPKTRLRLYPGGVPQTKIVKLRVMRQYVITTPALEWGFIEWTPADMRIPFPGSKAAGTVLSHKNLKMATTAAGGSTFSTNRQPYGYDHWLGLGSTAHSNYLNYKVLGSKIKITFVPSAHGPDAGDNYYAGFSQLFVGPAGDAASDDGPTLDSKYGTIAPGQISDWINAGVVKRRKVVTTGGSGSGFQSFIFYYSAKKWERQLKRMGTNYGTRDQHGSVAQGLLWKGTHGTSPAISPVCYFMMADIGTSTAGQAINCMITIEYTVQFSSLDVLDPSLG